MPIRKIARMGHPVLRQVAEPIPPELINSAALGLLIDDMLDTVTDDDGAGLAAPQVYESVRLVVLDLGDEVGFRVWINPVITPLTDELEYGVEGCLSVPGLRGLVGRPTEIEVHALDADGAELHVQLSGFPATVAQHEVDHLDGVLYVDKIVPRTLMFLEEYRRFTAGGYGEE